MTYSTGCCWWTVWWEQTVTRGSDGSRHLVSGTTISCSRTNRGGIFSKFWNNEMIQNLPLLIRDGWELLNQHMNHVWPGSLCSTTSPLIPLHVEMLTRKWEWLSLPPPPSLYFEDPMKQWRQKTGWRKRVAPSWLRVEPPSVWLLNYRVYYIRALLTVYYARSESISNIIDWLTYQKRKRG